MRKLANIKNSNNKMLFIVAGLIFVTVCSVLVWSSAIADESENSEGAYCENAAVADATNPTANTDSAYCEITTTYPYEVNFYYGQKRTTEGYDQYEVPVNAQTYNDLPWYNFGSSTKKVTFEDNFKSFKPTSCCCWFLEFDSAWLPEGTTVEISGVENIDTSQCTNMWWMFGRCKAANINTSALDTSKVTNMYRMFSECTAQITGLETFNTSNVTNMSHMFDSATSQLNLSSFNTSKVQDFSGMFNFYCEENAQYNLNLSSFNTANGTDFNNMLANCYALDVDISNFDLSNATNLDAAFGIIANNIKWPSRQSMLKDGCTALMLFAHCNCNQLNTKFIDTKNITDMSMLFNNTKIADLNVSNLNTSKVTNMNAMFESCKTKVLNISNFDVSNVANMCAMFDNFGYDDSTIVFPARFATNVDCFVYSMFSYCNCQTIDCSAFNFANMYDFENFFMYCTNTKTILMPEGTDFAELQEASVGGKLGEKQKSLEARWSSGLMETSANSNATDLQETYSSSDIKVFTGCTNLVGQNGTTFQEGNDSISYAHIDTPENPGYFTVVKNPNPDDTNTTASQATNTSDANGYAILGLIVLMILTTATVLLARRIDGTN